MGKVIYGSFRVSVCPECSRPVQIRMSPTTTYLACPNCPNRWILDDDPAALTIRPVAGTPPFPPFIPFEDLESHSHD